jgi:sulfite reductase beta subunit-like hemoprotein
MDALMPRTLHGVRSATEQARAMFLRDEMPVEAFERVIDREMRR